MLLALVAGVLRANAAATNTVVFLETMATNAIKPWTGSGCNNPWTVTFSVSNPFEQNLNANYGGGNPNGLSFKSGTTNLGDSIITTTLPIDARGNSATLTFYLQVNIASSNAGWAMQLNPGTGFTTRLSGQTSTSQNWQLYTYNLQPGDLVSNLTLRFEFSEGGNRQPDISRPNRPHDHYRHFQRDHSVHRAIRADSRRQFFDGRPVWLR